MLNVKHLLRLKLKAKSNREVAGALGLDRNTVNRYVQFFDGLDKTYEELFELPEEALLALFPQSSQKEMNRYEVLSGMFSQLESDLKKVGATYQNVWERYRRNHPDGYACTQFKKHLQHYQQRSNVTMRVEHKFGEKLFVDFTGKKLPVTDPASGEVSWKEVFVAILGGSQYTYVEATESQRLEDFLNALQNALHFFEGVPQAIVPDNLKSAVTRADNYEPEVNRNFHEFGLHYGCVILPTRAYKARDKALVEGAVRLAYQRIFWPLNEVTFYRLADLNAAIRDRLGPMNNCLFQHREYSRRELFLSQEKALLERLPTQRFERKIYREGKVKKDAHVWFGPDKHYYSVPWQHLGKLVFIQATERHIEVYLRQNHQRIALHSRNRQAGGFTTRAEHLPANIRFVKNWGLEQFSAQARKIGPSTHLFFQQIFEHKAHPEQAFKACMGMLKLAKVFPPERLETACRRAAFFKNYTYKAVRKILEKGLDQVPWEPHATTDSSPILDASHPNIRGGGYYSDDE